MKRAFAWLPLAIVVAGTMTYLIVTQHERRKPAASGRTGPRAESQARPPSIDERQTRTETVEGDGRTPSEATKHNSGEGGHIPGTVTDEDGKPLPEAQVVFTMGTGPSVFGFGGAFSGFGFEPRDNLTDGPGDEPGGDSQDEAFGGECGGGFVEGFGTEDSRTAFSGGDPFKGGFGEGSATSHDRVETGADGTYLSGLLQPGTYSAVACGRYHYPAKIQIVEVERGVKVTGVNFILKEGASVVFHAVD